MKTPREDLVDKGIFVMDRPDPRRLSPLEKAAVEMFDGSNFVNVVEAVGMAPARLRSLLRLSPTFEDGPVFREAVAAFKLMGPFK